MIWKENLADSSNYGGKRSKTEYIIIHYTGNDGATDEANANYFRNNKRLMASAHLFVDDDSCTVSVPLDNVSYSVGDGKNGKYGKLASNYNSINVEMCDTCRNGTYDLSEKTKRNTMQVVAMLMLYYKIPIGNVIRHYDVSNKHCPAYLVDEKKWSEFKMELTKEFGKTCIEAINLYAKDLPCDDWATKELNASKALGITDGTRPKALVTREECAIMCYRSSMKGR